MLLSLLPPEAQLLFLSVSGSERDPEIRQLLTSDLDWVELCRLAEHEKAIPVLWRRINSVAPGRLPPEVDAHFSKLAKIISFRMSYLEQLVLNSATSLDRAGIEHVLLKGSALACAVYGSFTERPMVDFDLLVRKVDADSAVDALFAAGWVEIPRESQLGDFSKSHHLAPLVDPNRLVSAEVHTSLLPPLAPFGITTDEVLSSRQSVSFQGSEVRVPAPQYLLLHTCLHFAWNPMLRRSCWRTFRDVLALISRYDFDWDDFVKLAHSRRAGTCCFWTLHLAHELVGASIPNEVLKALEPELPTAALRTLERHFVMILLPTATACPSVTLRRMMWVAGIQPGRSGHGSLRPWKEGIFRPQDAPALAGRWDVQRAAKTRRSGRTWVRYWTSVLLAAPAHR